MEFFLVMASCIVFSVAIAYAVHARHKPRPSCYKFWATDFLFCLVKDHRVPMVDAEAMLQRAQHSGHYVQLTSVDPYRFAAQQAQRYWARRYDTRGSAH